MFKSQHQTALWATLVAAALLPGLFLCSQTASSQRGLVPESASAPSPLRPGPYYALVIGNNDYKFMAKLNTPVNDAKTIAQLLQARYGFQTEVLTDADRSQIMTALVNYRRTLHEDSNLLIYYAGHGHHDPDTDEAYWLPIDAQPDNPVNWISADDITSNVKAIPSAHVLIISDSCYSGYIVAARSGNAGINPEDRYALVAKMLGAKSRNLMSSGGDEPVADDGAPGHSVFAAAILDSLRQVDEDTFTAADLFYRYVQPEVGGRSRQLPQYNWINNSGHKNGDFVFFRKPGAKTAPVTQPAVVSASPARDTMVKAASKDTVTGTANRASRSPATAVWVVGGNGAILHSEDGGISWIPQNSGTTEILDHVVFVTPQSGWILARNSAILHTEDGGNTWSSYSSRSSSMLISAAFTEPNSGWAVGWDGVMMRTEDRGVSWRFENIVSLATLNAIVFATPQAGWIVGTKGTILHTGDGGNSWEPQASDTTNDLISVFFATPKAGWAVGDRGTILHTDDGGLNWRPQHSVTSVSLYSVAFANLQSGWAVGNDGIIQHTNDGGLSWKLQTSGTTNNLTSVVFATPQSGWVVDGEGTILHTDDGGLSWNLQRKGTHGEFFNSIALAPLP